MPITEAQQALAGTWQVDSVVTTYNNKLYADSVYKNHFITITNTGNIVHFNMPGSDIMNYTITGNYLQPYYGRSAIGCGTPFSSTQFVVAPNNLRLIVGYEMITTTYLHR